MRATVLIDNIEGGEIRGEWGLSFFIEHNDRKILLDAGASSLFVTNADKLGISVESADTAVLSHAHYDHSNGLEQFFEINKKAKLFVCDGIDDNCYFKLWFIKKYIGNPKGILEKYSDRIEKTVGLTDLGDGIYLLPHTTKELSEIGKRERMYRKEKGKWIPDDFSHEQSLIFDTEKGLVIFNSCCHGGAANIVNEVQNAFPNKNVYALIGGFHIYNKSEKFIKELADKLIKTDVKLIYTGHCSGQKGYDLLRDSLGDRVRQLKTGLEINI